jgi:hypothetical protein
MRCLRSCAVPCALPSILALALACGGGGGSSTSNTSQNLPTEGWTLTNDADQVAWVTIQPFTYSGTFDEVSDSPGWWLLDGTGNPVLRIPVSGSISHAGTYDQWDFTVTVSGGGYHVLGQGSGQSDGTYPTAQTVIGTLTGTVTSPLGTQQTNDSWTGDDYTIWNTTGTALEAPVRAAAGAAGLTASVPSRPGATYAWHLDGGTLTSGGDTERITFTAGPGIAVLLRCTVTVPGREPVRGVATVRLAPGE